MFESFGWGILFLLIVMLTIAGFVLKLSIKVKFIIVGLLLLFGGPGLYNLTMIAQQTFHGAPIGTIVMNDAITIGTSYKEWDKLTGSLAPVYKPLNNYTDTIMGNETVSKNYVKYSTGNMWLFALGVELFILICLTWIIEAALKLILGKKGAPDEKEAEIFLYSLLLALLLGVIMTWGYPGVRTLIMTLF